MLSLALFTVYTHTHTHIYHIFLNNSLKICVYIYGHPSSLYFFKWNKSENECKLYLKALGIYSKLKSYKNVAKYLIIFVLFFDVTM